MSTTTEDGLFARGPIIALRDRLRGTHRPLVWPDDGRIYVGSDRMCNIVLADESIAGMQLELRRSDNAGTLVARSVGRRRVRTRGITLVDFELHVGHYLEVSPSLHLLMMSAAMIHEVEALEFFLGIGNHLAVSDLLYASNGPVLLVGSTRPAREILARRLHLALSLDADAFMSGIPEGATASAWRAALARPWIKTAFVDTTDADRLEPDPPSDSDLVKPPMLMFGAPSVADAQRVLPPEVTAVMPLFALRELDARQDARASLAGRVLGLHGLTGAPELNAAAREMIARVIEHPEVDSLDDLWLAPVRLVALFREKGNAAGAKRLLAAWGYDESGDLNRWIHKVGIDRRILEGERPWTGR